MRTFAYGRRRFFIAPAIITVLAVFSALIMILWNVLMPVIFNLPPIKFWQAVGLLVLSRLLFGMNRSHSPWGYSSWRHSLHEKISKMTPEEKKEFYKKMHTMRHTWFHENSRNAESTEKSQTEQ